MRSMIVGLALVAAFILAALGAVTVWIIRWA
jgi:hypothetical protein